MKTLGSLEVPHLALPRVLVHPRVLVRNSRDLKQKFSLFPDPLIFNEQEPGTGTSGPQFLQNENKRIRKWGNFFALSPYYPRIIQIRLAGDFTFQMSPRLLKLDQGSLNYQ